MVDPFSHPLPGLPAEDNSSITVMIVDDDPDLAESLSMLLEEPGYQVRIAGTGREALDLIRVQAAKEEPISVALLDIRLPDMQGTELLNAIKREDSSIVCIMTTGDESVDLVIQALNGRASAYFLKPVDPPELLATINEQMKRQRLALENQNLLASLKTSLDTQRNTIRHLRRLQDLARKVSSTLEVDEVLQAVRNAVIDVLGYDRCGIFLVDAESNQIQGRWGTDREGRIVDITSTVLTYEDDLPISKVARGDIPYFLTDDWGGYVEEHIGAHPYVDLEGIGAHAILPLVAKDRIVGVLSVDNLMRNAPITEADIRELEPFTYQAAIAIDNARLYKNAQDNFIKAAERASELQMLWQVAQDIASELSLDAVLDTVVKWVCAVMSTPYFSLFLFNKSKNELEVRTGSGLSQPHALYSLYSHGKEAVGHAVMAGGERIMDNLQNDPESPLGQLAGELGLHSMLCLPLRVGDEPIGMMAVYSQRPHRFSESDRRLLSTLASMASTAINNAQFYDRERHIAETMQRELLTIPPEVISGYGIKSIYQSALHEARIGGDFFDVVELPCGRIALLLADVSGKGLKAAVYTAMGKYMFRGLLVDDPSPGLLLERLNAALCRYTEPGLFITLFYGLLDPATGILKYANAGHESPIHYHAEYECPMTLDTTGVVLGVDPTAVYVERETRLRKDDVLLLYTDGVTDARRDNDMLGIEGLQEILVEAIKRDPSSIVETLYNNVRRYAMDQLHDDIALLCVRSLTGPREVASETELSAAASIG